MSEWSPLLSFNIGIITPSQKISGTIHYFLISFNLSLGNLCFTIMSHIHLTIFVSACWSVTSFSFLTCQVSLLCHFCTQLLYNLPLMISDTSLLVSNGTNCLNLFHPIQILASTAASVSPSIQYNTVTSWQHVAVSSCCGQYKGTVAVDNKMWLFCCRSYRFALCRVSATSICVTCFIWKTVVGLFFFRWAISVLGSLCYV